MSDLLKQHQNYARTGSAPQDETFGLKPHNHTHKPHSEPKGGRKRPLADHQRGAVAGIKYRPSRMAMQAAPDHGDHE
jgi:hypothetical protein